MNLSKLKFVLVGVIIMGVLSLNFTNPFTVPNEDVKGIAHEMSISTISAQTKVAIPTLVVTFMNHLIMEVYFISQTGSAMLNTNTDVFDGIAKISTNKLAMNKLD